MSKQREDLNRVSDGLVEVDKERSQRRSEAIAEQQGEPVVLLPDGSAFTTVSYPLPAEHWLYREREYATPESPETIDLPPPFVPRTLQNLELVRLAAKWAIRAATNCGKQNDFDPDAMVQNFVYATLGPYPGRIGKNGTHPAPEAPEAPAPQSQLSTDHREIRLAVDTLPAPGQCVPREDIELAMQMLTWGRGEGLTAKQDEQVLAHQKKLHAMLAAAQEAPAPSQPIAKAQASEPAQVIGDEWTPCMKLPIVVYVRKQHKGEKHVSTREGITPVKPDDLIMRGVSGEEYPIGREIFEKTYTLDVSGESTPKREWVCPTDEQAWAMWEAAVFVANKTGTLAPFQFAKNITTKLKELNHG